MPRLLQLCAWALLAAIAVLSIVPPSVRATTALPHDLEHAIIFAMAGLAVALAFPRHALRHMTLLTVFSAAIELVQLFVPGRHARISDFLVDAAAACAGVLLGLLIS